MDVEITESDFNGKETFFDTEKWERGRFIQWGAKTCIW